MISSSITRRDFLKHTSVAAAALASSSAMPTASAQVSKPNIVFIMADDLGWSELGCYGQQKIRTPNVDRLAEQGIRFTQYYAGSAVCAPSRCNLLTGKHGGHAYVRDNLSVPAPDGKFGGQIPIPAEEETAAETLKRAGYATGCFGKWGLGPPKSEGGPLNQGFDRFYGYNDQAHAHNLYPRYLVDQDEEQILEGNTRGLTGAHYAPQRIADEILDFVREHQDAPFFLYYATVLPHLALQVPDEYVAMYRGQCEETPYEGKSYLPHPTPRACYAAMISFMDAQVGRLMDLLQELGLADNTVVFFTSDNGTSHLAPQVDADFFDSVGPLRGLKGSLYEGGIRVPMVAWWPGHVEEGTVTNHLAAHYDVPKTLAAIAGAERGVKDDGVSFLPELLGERQSQAQHEFLFWDFHGYGGQIAVRQGKWKGIKRDIIKNPDASLELYNLEEDIGESKNVASEHPEVAMRLEQIMVEARTRPQVEAFRFGKYAESPRLKGGEA